MFHYTGLTAEEEEELSQKLSMLNKVLDQEVEVISNQHRRIKSEGFQITQSSDDSFSSRQDNGSSNLLRTTSNNSIRNDDGEENEDTFFSEKNISITVHEPQGKLTLQEESNIIKMPTLLIDGYSPSRMFF